MEEKAKKKIEQNAMLRILKGRRRTRYVESGKEDYGEGANRPDISQEAYKILVQEHMEKLRKDQTNRAKIERETVDQSNCELWHQKRSELLTASNFGKICRKKESTSCATIVKSILYPPVLNLPALKYGLENEESSRIRLSKKLKRNIELAGLIIDEKDEYLGASVDGFLEDQGIVELKNPISAANMTIAQALNRKSNIRRIFDKEDINKMNIAHEYYYQVQGQLHISNRKYCIFAVCTKVDLKFIKVEHDDTFWENMMAEPLRKFYFDCLLPEILDGRYNRNMALREPEYVIEARRKKKESTDKSSKTTKDDTLGMLKKNVNRRKVTKKRKETSRNEKKPKRSKKSSIQDENNVGIYGTDQESLEQSNVYENEDSTKNNGESIENQRAILDAIYENINLNDVYANILNVTSRLNDDSIESFLQLVHKKAPQYEIHPTIYFHHYDLLPEQFIGYHGKTHLQIIGGDPQYEHWICIRYDGKYLQIYDSLNRTNTTQLQNVEKNYFRRRYPQLKWENVSFAPVTTQPDALSCGVYCIAFMVDLI